jgi:hypothetical protein
MIFCPCTVIYDERRAYYDCGTHLRGSQRGASTADIRTGFHIEFQPDDLFRGVHPVMSVDRSGQGDTVGKPAGGNCHQAHSQPRGPEFLAPTRKSPGCSRLGPLTQGRSNFFPRQEDVFVDKRFREWPAMVRCMKWN